jgi:hypothetical protein
MRRLCTMVLLVWGEYYDFPMQYKCNNNKWFNCIRYEKCKNMENYFSTNTIVLNTILYELSKIFIVILPSVVIHRSV